MRGKDERERERKRRRRLLASRFSASAFAPVLCSHRLATTINESTMLSASLAWRLRSRGGSSGVR